MGHSIGCFRSRWFITLAARPIASEPGRTALAVPARALPVAAVCKNQNDGKIFTLRAIVSADRLTAAGMVVFDSIGYREDGTPYDRPGRATVVFGRGAIGADWM
jgi:hypothetical protein